MDEVSRSVLVLDIDVGFRAMCGQIVAMLGHDVVEVDKSEVALDLARVEARQVIIVDWGSAPQPQASFLEALVAANPEGSVPSKGVLQ